MEGGAESGKESGVTPIQWLLSDDTGTSSKTIWRHMMGERQDPRWQGPPDDPDDFGRCYRLLAMFPEWRVRLDEMAIYAEWAGLVDAWAELESLYLEELPSGEGPRLWKRMKQARKAAA